MATVTIDGTDFESYAALADANDYLKASINTEEWDALTDDGKGKLLVTATRIFALVAWTETPPDATLETATIELANILADDPDALNTKTTSLLKRVKAGSVEVENFRSTASYTSPFPPVIMTLLKDYLPSVASIGAASSYGVDTESVFDDCDRPTFNGGI